MCLWDYGVLGSLVSRLEVMGLCFEVSHLCFFSVCDGDPFLFLLLVCALFLFLLFFSKLYKKKKKKVNFGTEIRF